MNSKGMFETGRIDGPEDRCTAWVPSDKGGCAKEKKNFALFWHCFDSPFEFSPFLVFQLPFAVELHDVFGYLRRQCDEHSHNPQKKGEKGKEERKMEAMHFAT